ncbi:MAG: type I-E CRISPR-associated protein Cse1/CasA [Chloroflexota bacterium]|nr:type I-E CRISPR-associated protein Cse1/CasA [Chloroflexota bacterium]
MGSYNLLEEKWIDCFSSSGENQTVSLADLILNAHRIESLSSAIPIINNSMMFLVEALLLSVYSKHGIVLADHDNWMNLFKEGNFEESLFLDYFQSWKHRFNLFDKRFPFLQTPIKEKKEGEFTGTAMKLMPHFSGGTGGNTITLFDHHTIEEGLAFTPEQAAQFLLPAHYYGAGGRLMGRDYFSASNIANGLSFYLEGKNMFETLLLNLLPYPEIDDVNSGENDRPIWESDIPYSVEGRLLVKENNKTSYLPFGLMDILTWPGRKIELIQDNDSLIRNIKMRAGLRIKQDYFPWFAYNRNGYFIRAREGKLMWRDYDILLQYRKMISPDADNRPPQAIDHLYELVSQDYLADRLFTIKGAGMAKEASQQKVHFYTEAVFPIPVVLLENNDLIIDISDCLDSAEKIRRGLYGATAALADGVLSFTSDHKDGRKPDKKDRNNLINHINAEAVYWAALEPNFYDLINHLLEDRENSLVQWQRSIQSAARGSLAHAIRLSGESVAVLKASVRARSILEKNLKEKLPLLGKDIVND